MKRYRVMIGMSRRCFSKYRNSTESFRKRRPSKTDPKDSLLKPLSQFLNEHEQSVAKQIIKNSAEVESIFPTAKELPLAPTAGGDSSSLFEVFSIPEEPPPRSKTAFNWDAYNSYSETLESMMEEDGKFMRRHTAKPIPDNVAQPIIDSLRSEEPLVAVDIPVFEESLLNGISVSRKDADRQVNAQKARFMSATGFTQLQYKQYEGALQQLGRICAKKAKGLPVEVIWAKLKEAGSRKQTSLHNLLYVTSTFTTGSQAKRQRFGKLTGTSSITDILGSIPNGVNEDPADNSSLVDITDELAVYHDLLYQPTEQSVLTRVRLLVAQGKAHAAETTLLENDTGFHLRSYTPVLRLHIEQQNMSDALRLYKRMKESHVVHFEAETYLHLICGLAEHGYFRNGAKEIDGARSCGFDCGSGPKLLDNLVSDLAGDILDLPDSLARRLYNAIGKGFPEAKLDNLPVLAPIPLTDKPTQPGQLMAARVFIEPSSGRCPHSQIRLRLIGLDEEQQVVFRQNLLKISGMTQTKFSQENKFSIQNKAEDAIEKFMDWLNKRKGSPYTTIIDGPNVGYYLQNYDGGRFSYHQLEFAVQSLEAMGEKPLIIMPRKYTMDRFRVTLLSNDQMRLTSAEKRIRNKLIMTGKLYLVPPGNLDDYFWILSSLSKQENSRKGQDLTVKPNDPRGRWPGIRPIIITNDQMRDHRMELIEARLFRRWYSNYIVHYNFIPFVDGKCTHKDIGFNPADFFSREIQANSLADGSTVWHFPLEDAENEWFVLSLPK